MSQSPPSDKRIDPDGFSIGIVATSYNEGLVESLLEKVKAGICENGRPAELLVERVPGSHEIPCAVNLMLNARPFSCMIGPWSCDQGCHFTPSSGCREPGNALQSLSIRHGVPIINGIVVTDDLASAEERITGDLDRGSEFARAALEMAQLYEKWTKT